MVRGKFGRAAPAPAKFKPGDRVRAKNIHPATHTRLPRYVRGHVGVVERDHGCQVFPDSAAMEAGENPQWLYTVVFDGAELWGPDADPTLRYPSTRSSRIWSRHDGRGRNRRRPAPCPAFPATTTGRCFANRGKRRPLRWRWRCMRAGCSPGTNGRPRLPMKSSARRRGGDPDTGETYYRHWLATLERLVAAKGRRHLRNPAPLSRCLGPRRRPHAAWFADRIEAGGFWR